MEIQGSGDAYLVSMVQRDLVVALRCPNSTAHTRFEILQCKTLDDKVLLGHMRETPATGLVKSIGSINTIDAIVLDLFLWRLARRTIHNDWTRRRSPKFFATRLIGLVAGLRSQRVGRRQLRCC
jgi:hypothetical protein